jgi:aspartate/methionine/tyrosine aminotransferase
MLFSIVLSSVVDPGIGIMVPNPGFPLYDRTLKILGLAFSLDKNLNL